MLQELYTKQGENITKTPWQEYPRPQLKRDSYVNLNGLWDFTVNTSFDFPRQYGRKILVPFCPESLLSGIKEHSPERNNLWYRRKFTLPEGFNKGRVLLHIGAADQRLIFCVNQKLAGAHIGG